MQTEKSSPDRILFFPHRHTSPHIPSAQSILSSVEPSHPTDSATQPQPVHHSWIYRRIALPILALLRMGASPKKLAWSLSIGFIIGLNPILGSTTILCLIVAFIFRLNVAASQIGNHLTYPLQVLLLIPFIRLGSRVFHTAPMPLSPKELLSAARNSPIALSRQLWSWEWHAFVLWMVLAAIAMPLGAMILTPLLRRLLRRIEHHQYPVFTKETNIDHGLPK